MACNWFGRICVTFFFPASRRCSRKWSAKLLPVSPMQIFLHSVQIMQWVTFSEMHVKWSVALADRLGPEMLPSHVNAHDAKLVPLFPAMAKLLYTHITPHNSSIRCDEGLTLAQNASFLNLSWYVVIQTLSTRLIKPNFWYKPLFLII